MNWYKIAKIGDEYLKAKGVPEENISDFTKYLHQFPDSIQKYLMKNFIIKNPNMTIEELQAIPLEVGEEIKISRKMEKLVKQISSTKEERQWLRKLVENGRFQKEDTTKLQLMLSELRNLPKEDRDPIEKFKDDVELSEYLNLFKMTQPVGELPSEGWERIENIESDDNMIEVYHITNQKALDAIGKGANWCVLSSKGGRRYHPFEYFCFIINGQPEILIHSGSGQIKDRNDGVVSDGSIIKAIDPVVNAYGLNTHEGDFRYYDQKLEMIKKFDQEEGNEEYITEAIENNAPNFTLLDKDKWSKYVSVFGKSLLNTNTRRRHGTLLLMGGIDAVKEINHDALAYLATHFKINNPSGFAKMENIIMEWFGIQDDNLTVGRYRKMVPEILHTTKVNNYFKELREEKIIEQKNSVIRYPLRWELCPFEEVKRDPEVIERLKDYWKGVFLNELPAQWDTVFKDCPLEEWKNDPETWKNVIISGGFYDNWDECPVEEVKYDEDFWKRVAIKYPDSWEKIHLENVKNDPEVIQASKNYWIDYIKEKPMNAWKNCPFRDVREIPELKQMSIEWWTSYLTNGGGNAWNICPHQEVKDNYEVRKKMMLNDPTSYRHFYPSQLKEIESDPAYWKEKMIKEPSLRMWDNCPFEELKQDPEIRELYLSHRIIPASTEKEDRLWAVSFNDNFIGKF